MYQQIIINFFDDLLNAFYPVRLGMPDEAYTQPNNLKRDLRIIFDSNLGDNLIDSQSLTHQFFEGVEDVKNSLDMDLKAIFEGDPAAKSELEIVLSYPGFYAIAAYRVAHLIQKLGVQLIPRIITEHAHARTGIDIHPGAKIGSYFCIDHGTGIVIGETTVIGNHVKIYQGVTLGAMSVSKKDAQSKRHPSIGDHVVIYAQATVLGGETIIGNNSVVGGNVWLTNSLPENTKIYYKEPAYERVAAVNLSSVAS